MCCVHESGGGAIDADQGAHICCVCAAKYRKWAEPRRLPGNPHMPLVAPRACGAVRNVADCKGAVADCKPNMAVAPRPCGTVQIAADCKGAVADYKPNMAKLGPGTAGRMCHSPIGNCQVLCAASAHTCGGGGCSILVVIKPSTIAEIFTTQRRSRR